MKKRQVLQYVLTFGVDASALVCSCVASWLIFDRIFRRVNYPLDEKIQFYEVLAVAFLGAFLCFSQTQNILRRTWVREVRETAVMNLIMLAMHTVLMTVSKAGMLDSRYMMLGVPLINTVVMLLFRQALKRFLRKPGALGSMQDLVGVITVQEGAAALVRDIQRDWTKRVVGLALMDGSAGTHEAGGVPVMAGYADCLDWILREPMDEVYIALPMDTGDSLLPILRELESMGTTVYILVPLLEKLERDARENDLPAFLRERIEYCAGSPVVSMAATKVEPLGAVCKRAMDIAGGLVGCLITIPILLLVAIPQQIESPGPLLFRQKRVGLNGRVFEIYKIRSMYPDAERRKKELMDRNEMNGLMFKMADDPRVTRVGRFIRKTSLDEFPQFFNVLRGDMSLVGTRPPTLDEYDRYENHHKRRLSMKPGLTGLWQVSGRSSVQDFEEIVRLDVSYIDHWSIWLDIKIILKTIVVVFTRYGAE